MMIAKGLTRSFFYVRRAACNSSDPTSPLFWRPWDWSRPASPSRCSASTGVRTESAAVISAPLITPCARILIPASVPFSTRPAATPRARCIIIPALIRRSAVPPTPRECEHALFFVYPYRFSNVDRDRQGMECPRKEWNVATIDF